MKKQVPLNKFLREYLPLIRNNNPEKSQFALHDIITRFHTIQILKTGLDLGLIETLSQDPQTIDELIKKCKLPYKPSRVLIGQLINIGIINFYSEIDKLSLSRTGYLILEDQELNEVIMSASSELYNRMHSFFKDYDQLLDSNSPFFLSEIHLRVLKKYKEEIPEVLEKIYGFIDTTLIFHFHKLSIFDNLSILNMSSESSLIRQILTNLGLIDILGDSDIRLSVLGNYLSTKNSSPEVLNKTLLSMFLDIYPLWASISYTIKNETHCVKKSSGFNSFWEYISSRNAVERFSGYMLETSNMRLFPEIDTFSWNKFSYVLDIGGSRGALISRIILQHPHISAGLLDLPPLKEYSTSLINKFGSSRFAFFSGDFYREIPCEFESKKNFNCYILSRVLIDQNNEKAKILLKNIAKSLKKSENLVSPAILLIVEPLIDYRFLTFHACFGILLLQGVTGMVRTKKEIDNLLELTGFCVSKLHNPTKKIENKSYNILITQLAN